MRNQNHQPKEERTREEDSFATKLWKRWQQKREQKYKIYGEPGKMPIKIAMEERKETRRERPSSGWRLGFIGQDEPTSQNKGISRKSF